MKGIKKIISDKEIINWLLEKDNPSIRYFTLRDLLDKRENNLELEETKSAIPDSKIISKILSKQKPQGYWEDPENPYFPKYESSYWQIMILGHLGIDITNKRVKNACEHIFKFQLDEGGFTSEPEKLALRKYNSAVERGRKMPSRNEWISSYVFEQQLSCLTGNIVAALIRLGYKNDYRVNKALNWLVKIQNKDGGWLCPYWKAHIKDKHGCFYGTIGAMEGFSEVPERNLTREMKKTIGRGAEFLLVHHLFKTDHHNYRIIHRGWLKFGFPWFYRYHILRGLDVLTKLGYSGDKRLNDAVQILLQKRCSDRKWILESSPTGRMQANIETVGKPSKWITLIALKVLKRIYKQKYG